MVKEKSLKKEDKIICSKVLLIDEFLSQKELDDLFKFVKNSKSRFDKSFFLQNTDRVIDSSKRKSLILDKDLEEIYLLLMNRLIGYREQLESEFESKIDLNEKYLCNLIASNDGDFFAPHRDNGYGLSDDLFERTQNTAVFYFHAEPKGFEGGEFFIWDRYQDEKGNFREDVPSSGCEIEPRNNRMIIFNGNCLHEALPVKCMSQDFMDSRFCVVIRLP